MKKTVLSALTNALDELRDQYGDGFDMTDEDDDLIQGGIGRRPVIERIEKAMADAVKALKECKKTEKALKVALAALEECQKK